MSRATYNVIQGSLRLPEMSPQPKEIVEDRPVEVVHVHMLVQVEVLGQVMFLSTSGCRWDLIGIDRIIMGHQRFVFLVSSRLGSSGCN